MIDWNKKPYTEHQLREAWGSAVFVDDAACTLGVTVTTGNLRSLNRIAEECNLPTKPVWNRPYSVEKFKDAWNNSLSVQEVASKVGATSTRGLQVLATHLQLPDKSDQTKVTYTKETFISAWEAHEHLDEVALELGVSNSKQSLAKLTSVARTLGLPAKKIMIHTTDTGEDSNAIVADWIDWHNEHYKVNPLDTHVKIAAKKVKELIIAKYATNSIKWGLFQWTLAVHKGIIDPNIITSMTHQHHLANHPEVALVAAALENQNELASRPGARQIERTTQPPVIEAKKW